MVGPMTEAAPLAFLGRQANIAGIDNMQVKPEVPILCKHFGAGLGRRCFFCVGEQDREGCVESVGVGRPVRLLGAWPMFLC